MPVFAVDRDEMLRPGQLNHLFELVAKSVSGYMDVGNLFVNDVGASPVEIVDDLGYRPLVSGNELGGQHHRVPRLDLDLLVGAGCHAGQGRHRLALTAGGHDDDFIIRVVLHQVDAHFYPPGHLQIPQTPGDLGTGFDVAAADDHLAARVAGNVDDHLNAADVGGKQRHDDAPGTFFHDLRQGLSDPAVRDGGALPFDVGRV